MKKGVGSGVESGSGSISQRYESGDPDPHQNVTDPKYWFALTFFDKIKFFPSLHLRSPVHVVYRLRIGRTSGCRVGRVGEGRPRASATTFSYPEPIVIKQFHPKEEA